MYLDHASTSVPKAPGVAEAVARALTAELGGAGRGAHAAADAARRVVERCRADLARATGTAAHGVVLTGGATDAIHTALFGLLGEGGGLSGDRPRRVVMSWMEHHAVTRAAARLERLGRARVEVLGLDEAGRLDPVEVAEACARGEGASVCVVSAASNVTGQAQAIGAIARELRARSPGTLLVCDASQAAGVTDPRDPEDGYAHADLVAFGAHKGWRSAAGIGALLVGTRAFDPAGDPEVQALQPVRFGGTGGEGEGDPSPAPAAMPGRFEAGTAPVALAAGWSAGIAAHEPGAVERQRAWLAEVIARTSALPGLVWFGAAGRVQREGDAAWLVGTVPVASFAVEGDGWTPDVLAAALDASFQIRVRAGLHCASLAHRALGTAGRGGLVRVSPGPGAGEREADRFVGALGALLGG